VSPTPRFATPEARLYRPARAPRVYTEGIARLDNAVVAELPLGVPEFDARAVYYSTAHWRRILNGYSGFFPPHYGRLSVAAADVPRHPDLTIDAFRALGGTHVLVHESAYLGKEGEETSDALRTAGAVEVYRDGSDVILELPR
jgi:hypothetical protein